jgi:lipopolysaccharide transport system permease protein
VRPAFPTAVLPVVNVTTGMIHYILALPILVVVLLLEKVQLRPIALMIVAVVIVQFFLTLGLTYLFASANTFFADMQHLLNVGMQMFFYLTPVFYDIKSIPEKYLQLYSLNPMVHLLDAYRTLLLEGASPDWQALVGPCLLALGLVGAGHTIFARSSHRFAEEL